MVSKLEALRKGEIVVGPDGRKMRLNQETKSIEHSDGEILFAGDNPDLFPQNEAQRKTSLESEKIQKEISNFPLGKTAGEFAYQFGQKGAITSGIGDWVDRLTNTGETYLAKKQAKEQVGSQISEESPYMSMAATGASFVPDLLATRGMSAMKAVPALTAVGAGSRVLDDPGQVAGEAAIGAGAGFLLDKGASFLSRTAARRGASRQATQDAQRINAANITGEEQVAAQNLASQQAFNVQQQAVDAQNRQSLHQYNLAKSARENEMISAKNAYEQAKAAQSTDTKILKRQYETAQAQYKQAVDQMPAQQKAAQKQLSQRNSKYYDSISEQLPQDGTINTSVLGVEEFIDQGIRTGKAGTSSEGREASKIIRSLFEEGEEIGGKELSRRLRVLDEIIETSPRETQILLDQFKRSMGKNLSQGLAEEIAYRKSAPLLIQSVKKDIQEAFKSFKISKDLGVSKNELIKLTNERVEQVIQEMPRKEFLQKLKSGELIDDIVQKGTPRKEFIKNDTAEALESLRKRGVISEIKETPLDKAISAQYEEFVARMVDKLETSLANTEVKASQEALQARRLTSRRFREVYGIAEPVRAPQAPVEPVYPGAPTTPQTPPQVAPYTPTPSPITPTPQTFAHQAIPELGAPSGATGRLGDFLERDPFSLIRGRGITDMGPIGNIAKLKYLAGPKTAPLVAGYGMLKGITSPSAAGNVMRQTIQKGGVRIIVDQISATYPSYENGVLQNPQERKHAVAQIESNPDIPLEDKAMLQTYINRGKSIEKLSRY